MGRCLLHLQNMHLVCIKKLYLAVQNILIFLKSKCPVAVNSLLGGLGPWGDLDVWQSAVGVTRSDYFSSQPHRSSPRQRNREKACTYELFFCFPKGSKSKLYPAESVYVLEKHTELKEELRKSANLPTSSFSSYVLFSGEKGCHPRCLTTKGAVIILTGGGEPEVLWVPGEHLPAGHLIGNSQSTD